MDKQLTKSTKENLSHQLGDKKTYKQNIILGTIIAVFIAGIPFLFYLYEYVPDTKTWETFLGTYHSNYYQSANAGVWVLMMKFVPFILSFIWFLTCRHWWYHALIIPIVMFAFQFLGALNNEILFMDEFHIIWLLPFMCVIIPSIYLVRAQMFNKINYADKTMEELEAEFMLKPTTIWGKIKQYF